ncbi:class I SAM-dependent methyltransferase [Brevundimonas sp.]|uniref:class I SAM-dependent methyltransferase n=1 Tax=Brevundimonas sp. TaxID=1871086 RepID=UPI0035662DEE
MTQSLSDKRPGWHWTDYWRSGREEVMTVNTAAGPVTFETRNIWSDWFAAFDTGAVLLDLATGSGQVAGYAAATAEGQGKAFEVVGVDYAEVRPLAGCTLLGGVALEKLPFPASHFDGASSQFGIEYADSRLALAEVSRVLKPGGQALFLVHHADSAITRQTAAQISAYDRVMANGAAVRQARRAFSAHRKGLPSASVQAAEQVFAEAVRRAQDRLEPDPAFDPVRYLVGYLGDLADRVASYEPVSALARIDGFETGNSAWRHRQLCQTRAALDGTGLDGFVQRADRCGLVLADRSEIADQRGDLITWRLTFRKA